jgi:ABC-type polysaccharide transport system permease subunit
MGVLLLNRKITPFLMAIPAFCLLFIFKIIPVFYTFIITLRDYTPFKGIFGSPFVGISNYLKLFQSDQFYKLLTNSLILNSLSIILTCILVLILIICISKMPNRWFKLAAIIIISIPAFIPIIAYVGVFTRVLYFDKGILNEFIAKLGMVPKPFLTEPSYYPAIFAVMDALRNIFVPVIIGVLVCEKASKIELKKIGFVIIGYVAVRATMLLSPDIESILMSSNSMVRTKADVLDTYAYTTGFVIGKFSLASTVWMTKTIIQLLMNIVSYIILARLIPKILVVNGKLSTKADKRLGSIVGVMVFLIFAIGSILVIAFTFIVTPKGFFDGLKTVLGSKVCIEGLIKSLMYSLISCIVYALITITVAYPLTVKSKFYPIILFVLMSFPNNFIGEYLSYIGIGLINNILPVALGSGLTVIGAFALHFSVCNRFDDSIPSAWQYVRQTFPTLITIVILFFIASWSNDLYQLFFIKKTSEHGIGLVMRALTQTDNAAKNLVTTNIDGIRAAFIAVASVIPVTIGVVLICANKYLPLSSVCGQIRKG